MKHLVFVFIFFLLIQAAYSQHAKNTLALTVSGNDRVSVVKSSVRLAEWHEKAFWPVYENYMNDAVKVYSLTYRSLKDLAGTDRSQSEEDAFQHALNYINSRNDELALRKQYYQEVGDILNGVVALQFLQTESMMDMIESSEIYSRSRLKDFRFHPQAMSADEIRSAKHNTLSTALFITPEKENAFWNVYLHYEQECDALLGEAYTVYSLFASDAADFTPALAKRLGNDLLHLMEREINLKEEYFLEMNEQVGSNLASRFLAWEDYYSVVAKMHAWADAP